MALTGYEHALVQILIAKGFVEDGALGEMLEAIKTDFEATSDVSQRKETMFSRINNQVRKYSFEIKSVVESNQDNERVFYHGFVNVEVGNIIRTMIHNEFLEAISLITDLSWTIHRKISFRRILALAWINMSFSFSTNC